MGSAGFHGVSWLEVRSSDWDSRTEKCNVILVVTSQHPGVAGRSNGSVSKSGGPRIFNWFCISAACAAVAGATRFG